MALLRYGMTATPRERDNDLATFAKQTRVSDENDRTLLYVLLAVVAVGFIIGM